MCALTVYRTLILVQDIVKPPLDTSKIINYYKIILQKKKKKIKPANVEINYRSRYL